MLDLSFLQKFKVEDSGEVKRVKTDVADDGAVIKRFWLLHEGHGWRCFHGDIGGSSPGLTDAGTRDGAGEGGKSGGEEGKHFEKLLEEVRRGGLRVVVEVVVVEEVGEDGSGGMVGDGGGGVYK